MKRTLTLRPDPARVAPKAAPPVPADPVKIALAQALGLRFVCRQGRYILQSKHPVMVLYEPPTLGTENGPLEAGAYPLSRAEMTWVDIPLVPEVYG